MRYILALISFIVLAFISADVFTQSNSANDYVDGVVLVKFRPGAAKSKKDEAVASVEGDTEEEYKIVPGLQKISTNLDVQQAIAILSNNPNIEYAEPDFIVTANVIPNDPQFNLLWGMHQSNDIDINAPEAWDCYTGYPNFIIANIDTGVDINHEDLVGNIWFNPGETGSGKETDGIDNDSNGYVDDWRGWDFVNNDNNPADGHGHGTHTSGTTCAYGDNLTGVTGVVWDCKIMALKFLSDGGSGYTSDAIEAIQYATDKGVKVSNNSWGGGGYSSSLYNAINASKSVGHIFVAAAGNNSRNTDNIPHYPSSYNLDNIISVASITSSGAKSSFSNYGATSVDLGAPGSSIRSTLPGNSYSSWSGTSMATPHVTGVVALVYGLNMGFNYQTIIDQIYRNVNVISSMSGITVTDGIVDAECAVLDCDAGGPGQCPTPTPTPTATPTPTPTATPTPTPPAGPYDCNIFEPFVDNGNCDQSNWCSGPERLVCSGSSKTTECMHAGKAPSGSCCYSDASAINLGYYDCTTTGQPTPTPTPTATPTPTPTATPTPTPTPTPVCTHPKEKGPRCSDGLDNDCDGLIDGADPDC